MSDITEDAIRLYAARYGLTNLSPEHLSRMRDLAVKVASVSRSIPRMPEKSDEPAGITRFPLD